MIAEDCPSVRGHKPHRQGAIRGSAAWPRVPDGSRGTPSRTTCGSPAVGRPEKAAGTLRLRPDGVGAALREPALPAFQSMFSPAAPAAGIPRGWSHGAEHVRSRGRRGEGSRAGQGAKCVHNAPACRTQVATHARRIPETARDARSDSQGAGTNHSYAQCECPSF